MSVISSSNSIGQGIEISSERYKFLESTKIDAAFGSRAQNLHLSENANESLATWPYACAA